MQIDVSNVRGFEDYLVNDALKREKIKEISKKHLKIFGFMPIESPLVEYDEILKPNILPSEMQEEELPERFKFLDRSSRKLGIRTDYTIQLTKLLKKDPQIRLPVRFYQIDSVLKDMPQRPGRTRQFTLIEANIIGDSTQNAETELLLAISQILKELKIDFEININNKKLLESVLESIQIENKRQVIRELDKLGKIGEDLVKMNLKKYADSNSILTLFKMFEKSIEFFTSNAFEGADELNSLLKLCNKNNIPVRFNPFIIRNNYTGNIFEIICDKSSIAGGGRYDNVLGKYLNRVIPAVGISFSLESISELCKKSIENLEVEVDPKILIVSIDKENEAKKIVKTLRENEISCIMTSDKPGSSIDYANYYKIPYVIFLGNEEVEKQKFKFRIQSTGEEKQLTEKQLLNFFKKTKSQKKENVENDSKEE